MAHAADAGGQRRALVGDRSGGLAGTVKRVQNPSFARRISLSCCEQRLATAGAMESANWKALNRPRCAASQHCREGGANAPTATPEGSS